MEEQQTPSAPAAAPAKGKGMWIGIVVVAIVIIILLAAVFGGLFGPPEEQVLKVGTVLSITGGLSPFGPGNKQGVIMAFEEINAAGGVLGRPVELFHQNDDTKPETARSAATTLISQNHVDAIIGATGSGQCQVVIDVAKSNSVFEISGSCTSVIFANLTLTGGWWARTAPPDLYQSVVAASYASQNLSLMRAAVIGINNAYGVGLAELFAEHFVRLGAPNAAITPGSPVIVTEVQFGATDYTTDLETALDTTPPPEIVYIVAYPADGVQMMKDFERGKATHAGWANVKLLFSEGLYDSAFKNPLHDPPNNFDTTAYEGTAPSSFGGIHEPLYDQWSARFNTRWGEDAFLFDDNNYDAAYLVALAAQKAGVATGQAIKDNIFAVANPPGTVINPGEWAKALTEIAAGNDINYEGASGAADIDDLGDSLSGYIVWAVNATNAFVNKEVFSETLVVSLLPAPPAPVPALRDSEITWNPLVRAEDR
ncbi:MAG TPA: ABC transporter substrate-binding protein [Thermoplasmata archaeon]